MTTLSLGIAPRVLNLDPSRMLPGSDRMRDRYEASAATLRAALDRIGEGAQSA